jgi:hypothetical protein
MGLRFSSFGFTTQQAVSFVKGWARVIGLVLAGVVIAGAVL